MLLCNDKSQPIFRRLKGLPVHHSIFQKRSHKNNPVNCGITGMENGQQRIKLSVADRLTVFSSEGKL